MELVYLWVEDYKNIKKQGFNFSPNYECEFRDIYEDDNLSECSELVITSKDIFNQSLFNQNIFINALIGKNGSGKTSLLTLLIGGIFNNYNNWRDIKNLIILYKNHDNSFSSYSFSYTYKRNKKYMNLKFNTNIKVSKKDIYKGFYSLNDDLKYNYHVFMDFTIGQIDLWNASNKQENYKKFYTLEPSRNYLSKGPGHNSKIEPTSFSANMKANILYLYLYLDSSIIEKWKLPKFDKLKYLGLRRMGKPTKNYYKDEIIGKKILGMDFYNCQNYDNVKVTIEKYFSYNKEVSFSEINNEELRDISILFLFANIEFEDSNGVSFFSMSAGQKQLISYFGIIIRIIKEKLTKDKTLTLIIDEIETSLHPQWQKEFLKLLLELFDSIKSEYKNIQLILAGHSPFIVSDLPKENVIFLDNCTQVRGVEKKETFGSNIHTLLSDSFFIEGGLIGSFAKSKIDEVIKYLNDESSKEIKTNNEAQNIINIIGEPIIKRELQRKLDSKKLSKLDKIDEIEEQMKLLEHRLESIRKNQK